jgi:hypothetical protein
MSMITHTEEPSLRDQLLADYEAHEDRIEAAAASELWALGDWLAEYVPPRHPGPAGDTTPECPISLEDLAERGHRGLVQLRQLRKVALATEPDRLPKISPRAYTEALRQNGWDLMAANHALVTKGHRLRDQAPGAMESVEAIQANLAKRTPEERAEVAEELLREPTVRELLDGEPTPDLGAHWANRLVDSLNVQAGKLGELVKAEGLVFAPDTDLDLMLRWLEETETKVAEVRAAVQERIQDTRMEEVS